MKLNDKIALVTGASRGIGRATAVALAAAGADVAFTFRSHADEAEAVADEIRALGRRALAISGDVADEQEVDAAVAETVGQLGRLDIAVSNAAAADRGLFHELDMDLFRRTIDVTMYGAVHLLRAATRQLLAQGGGGSIVVISSPHARLAIPRSMPYNMAKAAVDQMARTAAIELAEHRIRVNIVHPGWIDTPGERKFASEEAIQQAGAKLPWGRLGRSEEIARGVVFLCDPASDYISGSTLEIDGAITLPWWANRGSAVPE
ncbi:MAG: SDR family oxidoreductase [Planctomycetales bacterium]|nr:SDR family oxidoreductase [Planctomycetales bacterium]